MKKNLQTQFKELETLILSMQYGSIINLKLKVDEVDGLEIIHVGKEDPHYLSHLGNSMDSPLTKVYSDKFVEAFGRLGKGKGKINDQHS